MKEINKRIIKTFFEIGIALFLIVFSWFKWGSLDLEKYRVYAAESRYSLLELNEITNFTNMYLLPVTDDEAINTLEPKIFGITNKSVNNKNYSFIIAVNKESSLNYDLVNIAIDNNIYNLNELNFIEDNENLYFTFDNNLIVDYNRHEMRMWIDIKADEEVKNKSLIFSIDIKENVDEVALK